MDDVLLKQSIEDEANKVTVPASGIRPSANQSGESRAWTTSGQPD